MRKLAAICLLLTIPGCAIGKLEDAAEALEEAEKTLNELDIAGCMDTCSAATEICIEEANGPCIDTCEAEEDVCVDQQKASCAYLEDPSYTQCMEGVYDNCDLCCDDVAGDCVQDCGNQAQDCLFGDLPDGSQNYSDCVALCIKEIEDDLKGIDL